MKKILIHYVDQYDRDRTCKPNSEKAKELHTCPFKVEIGTDDTLCDCDESATYNCAQDI